MSANAYSLTSAVFEPLQTRHVPVRVRPIGSLRYLILRLVGCWHRSMTRPFTQGESTYRACTNCGMRRDFDPETWRTKGRYYSGPASTTSLIDSGGGKLSGVWPKLAAVTEEKNAGEGRFGGVTVQKGLPATDIRAQAEQILSTKSPYPAQVTMNYFDAGPSPVIGSLIGVRRFDEVRGEAKA